MGRDKLMRNYGCKVLNNLNEAMTPEDIKKAIEKGDITADEEHKKCEPSCPWTYGCKVLNDLNEAMTPEDIREYIEDGTIEAKDHAACPFSCPWRSREYIEDLENHNFLIQDIVKEGGRNLKKENWRKVLPKAIEAIQDLDDPNMPLTTETKNKVTRSILDLIIEIEGSPQKV
jgi:ribosomal protein L19E